MVCGRPWPAHIAIDDACHVRRTVLELLVELVNSKDGTFSLNVAAWVLITLAACDICIDGFHFPNHKELWCQELLNPTMRRMLDHLNTQCVEQLWRRLVRWGSMLRYMNRGAHRLMYYTLVQSHNEKRKDGKVKATPRPKKHRTVHEFNRVKKVRCAVEALSSSRGRFIVGAGVEAFAPQMDHIQTFDLAK